MPVKISVIIPVYNVEKYLVECLESVINQDYRNLEIILIDDGSPDNSGSICDQYAQKDERIIVIHQKNQGPSGARNHGLKIATGDYISFIDSDDSIAQGMYSTIVNHLSNDIDVAYIPIPTFKNPRSEIYRLNKQEIRDTFIGQFIGRDTKIGWNKYMTSVCALCIRRELIKDLDFIKITYEDVPYFTETILRAETILIIAKKFYNYRHNLESISLTYNKNYGKDWTRVHQEIERILIKYNLMTPDFINRHNNMILIVYYSLIKNESLCKDLIIPNPALEEYYSNNKVGTLLTWNKALKSIGNKPKIFFIKLGLSNLLLKNMWTKK